MTRYNFSAKNLDEAITKACVELGVTSDKLDYKIVEQGSAGLLGIGARPWIIAACNKALLEQEEEAARQAEEKEKAEKAEKAKKAAAETKAKEAAAKAAVKEAVKDNVKETANTAAKAAAAVKAAEAVSELPEEVKEEIKEKKTAGKAVDGAELEAKAKEFLKSVFDSIGMDVNIEASYDDMLSELSVDLSGDDMGVLIGKRGQTLDSLQYLTGQVINKHQGGYVRVKLDTENYRERRHETLENLAHNMAHKVRRTRHPMALEPMNPYERRIIHSTLQDEKDVTTRSEGEEPYRHVVICYVKHKNK